MYNPGLTKAFRANAAAAPYTIAKFGAADYEATIASAATDLVFGVFTEVGAVSGDLADVVIGGMPGVKIGGTVTRGARLTSDASGFAIATTTSGNKVLGVAMTAGVSGDIIPVLLTPGVVVA